MHCKRGAEEQDEEEVGGERITDRATTRKEGIGGRRRAKTNLRLSGRFICKGPPGPWIPVHGSAYTDCSPVRKIFKKLSIRKRFTLHRNTIAEINDERIILNTEILSMSN